MAVQSDFQKYSAALNDWQGKGGRASGPPPQIVRDFQRTQGQARDAELKAKGYGPARFDQANKTLNRSLPKEMKQAVMDARKQANTASYKHNAPSRQDVQKAAKSGQTLHLTTPSSCFDSVTWKNGIVSVVFWNNYSYSAPLDLDTVIEWGSDDSLGKFFNSVLGQDYFASN
jgi:hypothetical protein